MGEPEKTTILGVVKDNTFIYENRQKVAEVCGSIMLAQCLNEAPRPKQFQTTLASTHAFVTKNLGVKIAALPNNIQTILVDALKNTAKGEKVSDAATHAFAAASSCAADAVDDGSGACLAPPLKKKKYLAKAL